MVGSAWDADVAYRGGAAYAFQRTQAGWGPLALLAAPDGTEEDALGYSAALSGQYAIFGAPGDGAGGSLSGSAYLFQVPEPMSLTLLALGAAAVLRRRGPKR